MKPDHHRLLSVSILAVLLTLTARPVWSDPIAFNMGSNGAFGTLDLATGVLTQTGNTGITPAGLAKIGSTLFTASTTTGLYTVKTLTGNLTQISNLGLNGNDYNVLGSTLTGLYALDDSFNLYSINPTTGAATLLGPTGVATGLASGSIGFSLSTGSSTLYFEDDFDLYSLNTTTGKGTLIGQSGASGIGFNSLVSENGTLYGVESSNTLPYNTLYTINTSTGVGTLGSTLNPDVTVASWGLAPAFSVPEPNALLLLGLGLLTVGALRFRGTSKSSAPHLWSRTNIPNYLPTDELPISSVKGLLCVLLSVPLALSNGGSNDKSSVPVTSPAIPSKEKGPVPMARLMKHAAHRMPSTFAPNVGQAPEATRFLATSKGLQLSLKQNAITFLSHTLDPAASATPGRSPGKAEIANAGKPVTPPDANLRWRTAAAHLDFIGANPTSKIEGLDTSTAKLNYFVGKDPTKWKSNVPMYSRVRYADLYPGIDMLFYGKPDGSLEYDLVVAPNADPSQIHFRVSSSEKAHLDPNGNLQLDGDLALARPMLYQDIDHGKKAIAGAFVQIADNEFAFNVKGYDRNRPLVIDPTISLLYSTYLGGNEDDNATNLVLDSQDNAYIIGYSFSQDFPVSANAYQSSLKLPPANCCVYNTVVMKISPSGEILYSTFLGGTGQSQYHAGDFGYGIAVDSNGNAYVGGNTNSLDFPVTPGAYSSTPGGGFISELSPDGSTLEYSSYFTAGVTGLALNPKGQIVIAGTAGRGLPTTTGAYKTTLASGINAAYASIVDLTKTGAAQLVASSYYGTDTPIANSTSTGNNEIGFTLDANGNVWLGGIAFTPNLPTTANAFQPSLPTIASGCGGNTTLNSAAYFAELSPDLSKLVYATYFSGKTSAADACSEFVNSMSFDSKGDLYLVGSTASGKFPVTSGVFQGTYPGNGSRSGFVSWVAKFAPSQFTPTSSAPVWSSYLGGNGGDTFFGNGRQVIPDASGNVWIVGQTEGGSNFPITANGYQTIHQGDYDGFAVEASADASQILYGTYLGGSSGANITAVGVDSGDNVYLTGDTSSTDFPVTGNAFQSQLAYGNPSHYGNDLFFSILGIGTINSIGPVTGGNTGDTTLTIDGAGLQSGATCQLTTGATAIRAIQASVNAAGTSISCTFALNGTSPGLYNVVVANPDGSSATKQSGFTVRQGTGPVLWTGVVGRPTTRANSPTTFEITYGNSGDTDAYFNVIWVAVPSSLTSVALDVAAPPQLPGQSLSYVGAFASFTSGDTTYFPLLVPLLAPGAFGSLQLQLTDAAVGDTPYVLAYSNRPMFESYTVAQASISQAILNPASVATTCATIADGLPASDCVGAYSNLLGQTTATYVNSNCTVPVATNVPNVAIAEAAGLLQAELRATTNGASAAAHGLVLEDAQTAYQTLQKEGCPGPTSAYTLANQLRPILANSGHIAPKKPVKVIICFDDPEDWSGYWDFIGDIDPDRAGQPSCHHNGNAIDPNYKSGPTGDASSNQFVPATNPLSYSVGFENEATATLPAATVIVTDQLDPTKVDLTTLSLGTISFGSNVINLPSGTNNYATVFTPPGVSNYVVRIQGGLNSTTGLLKWTFQTIDPTTGLPPSDPTVGFLPPDVDGIVGQGAVLFNVLPKTGITTGTQITNQATVVFDANAPINTPVWLNTIDATPPVSSVTALPAAEQNPTFTVSWSGSDVGSGIASYTIYVSDNGGPFTAWQSAVTVTSASYSGQAGHTYGFYTIATDSAGNVQAAKTTADTTTTVANSGSLQTNLTISTQGPVYNRGTKSYVVTVTLTNNTGAAIVGPIEAVFNNLPSTITLTNSAGTSPIGGGPYLSLGSGLAPGASAVLTAEFSDPTNVQIPISIVTYSGSF